MIKNKISGRWIYNFLFLNLLKNKVTIIMCAVFFVLNFIVQLLIAVKWQKAETYRFSLTITFSLIMPFLTILSFNLFFTSVLFVSHFKNGLINEELRSGQQFKNIFFQRWLIQRSLMLIIVFALWLINLMTFSVNYISYFYDNVITLTIFVYILIDLIIGTIINLFVSFNAFIIGNVVVCFIYILFLISSFFNFTITFLFDKNGYEYLDYAMQIENNEIKIINGNNFNQFINLNNLQKYQNDFLVLNNQNNYQEYYGTSNESYGTRDDFLNKIIENGIYFKEDIESALNNNMYNNDPNSYALYNIPSWEFSADFYDNSSIGIFLNKVHKTVKSYWNESSIAKWWSEKSEYFYGEDGNGGSRIISQNAFGLSQLNDLIQDNSSFNYEEKSISNYIKNYFEYWFSFKNIYSDAFYYGISNQLESGMNKHLISAPGELYFVSSLFRLLSNSLIINDYNSTEYLNGNLGLYNKNNIDIFTKFALNQISLNPIIQFNFIAEGMNANRTLMNLTYLTGLNAGSIGSYKNILFGDNYKSAFVDNQITLDGLKNISTSQFNDNSVKISSTHIINSEAALYISYVIVSALLLCSTYYIFRFRYIK